MARDKMGRRRLTVILRQRTEMQDNQMVLMTKRGWLAMAGHGWP
jgi:hypothetical protein